MNARDYAHHMEKHNLIESIESVENLANATRLNDNIKRVKAVIEEYGESFDSFALDPYELIAELEQQKETHIKLAIRNAVDKEWAIKQFGSMYTLQIKELRKNIEPTIAALGIIDIKHQMGVG